MDMSYYKKYEPIFGDWKIVRELGSGSFGKVFEIQWEDFGYTYKAALKAITIPQSQSELDSIIAEGMDSQSATSYYRGFVQELVEEFRLMSKLKGESNIVSYEAHKVIQHDDGIGWDILIRMELLTPLPKYVQSHSFEREDIARLGIDICKALELCRKHNIIHRDIKPDNIFVSDNGQFKLGDFGIAKTVEKTMSGLSKKGTYNYMAPEVYKGEEYGPSVDIYSLGIMLYRYLNNGRAPFLPPPPTPFGFNDVNAALARRMKGEPLPAPANADEHFAAVVLKACAYDPKERYASAAEMREDLEAVLTGLTPPHAGVSFGAAEVTPQEHDEMPVGSDDTTEGRVRTAADGTILLTYEDTDADDATVILSGLKTVADEEAPIAAVDSIVDEDKTEIAEPDDPGAADILTYDDTDANDATVMLSDLRTAADEEAPAAKDSSVADEDETEVAEPDADSQSDEADTDYSSSSNSSSNTNPSQGSEGKTYSEIMSMFFIIVILAVVVYIVFFNLNYNEDIANAQGSSYYSNISSESVNPADSADLARTVELSADGTIAVNELI